MRPVLIAYRSRSRGGVEIVGAALEEERIPGLMELCERTALEEYSRVRRMYGEVPSLEEFSRKLFHWTEASAWARERDPMVACANFGEWTYTIERRALLC